MPAVIVAPSASRPRRRCRLAAPSTPRPAPLFEAPSFATATGARGPVACGAVFVDDEVGARRSAHEGASLPGALRYAEDQLEADAGGVAAADAARGRRVRGGLLAHAAERRRLPERAVVCRWPRGADRRQGGRSDAAGRRVARGAPHDRDERLRPQQGAAGRDRERRADDADGEVAARPEGGDVAGVVDACPARASSSTARCAASRR